jgi:hypothetical protein
MQITLRLKLSGLTLSPLIQKQILLYHIFFSWHYLHTVSLEHKGQAITTMSSQVFTSVADFYHILMSNKLQWMYKEVQVVMVNLRYTLAVA